MLDRLTEREREILRLMALGLSNLAIREQLTLGEKTVESHIRGIFRKLGVPKGDGVNRRVVAVLTYMREGPDDFRGSPVDAPAGAE